LTRRLLRIGFDLGLGFLGTHQQAAGVGGSDITRAGETPGAATAALRLEAATAARPGEAGQIADAGQRF